MTPQEFKAWFEGFTEAFDRLPTKAQWARVKERVAEIDGKPVTERVFVDRFWPRYYHEYRPYWAYSSAGSVGGSLTNSVNTLATQRSNLSAYQSAVGKSGSNASFDSGTAMLALGRADAKALAA